MACLDRRSCPLGRRAYRFARTRVEIACEGRSSLEIDLPTSSCAVSCALAASSGPSCDGRGAFSAYKRLRGKVLRAHRGRHSNAPPRAIRSTIPAGVMQPSGDSIDELGGSQVDGTSLTSLGCRPSLGRSSKRRWRAGSEKKPASRAQRVELGRPRGAFPLFESPLSCRSTEASGRRARSPSRGTDRALGRGYGADPRGPQIAASDFRHRAPWPGF